ncbi:glycosyltransferase [Paenibacillus sp. FSL W8-0426]|uniref:glycosyltransferase n=1 Tax=Paenibacillus sp. FSL W8-0426 TaxID=2921714 RepID=UPI001F89F737|nr:Glycogen synthase [Paenibacillus sp. JJ-223]
MKILHIGEYVVGGVATYMNEVVAYQRNYFDVHLLLSDYNSASDFDLEPERICRYTYKRHPKFFFSAMKQIYQNIQRIQPDIIHVHSSFAGMLVRGLFFITRRKASVIYCSHGWSFLMDTKQWLKKVYFMIEKILEFKTDCIINVSKRELEQSIRFGMSPFKSKLVYSGISERQRNVSLDHRHSEYRSSEESSSIQLLFVGRYDWAKGLDILLDVFQQHQHLQQRITLSVVGEPVLEDDHHLHFSDNVIQIGWVNHEEIDEYYQKCDAVIMPSRWEGFGLTAVEAMKNKKPVIVSNRGALPELITHGMNGYVFDIDQSDELPDLLMQLDKTTLAEMGNKGYEIYKEKFSSVRMNEEIVNIYYEVSNMRGKIPAPTTKHAKFSERMGEVHD